MNVSVAPLRLGGPQWWSATRTILAFSMFQSHLCVWADPSWGHERLSVDRGAFQSHLCVWADPSAEEESVIPAFAWRFSRTSASGRTPVSANSSSLLVALQPQYGFSRTSASGRTPVNRRSPTLRRTRFGVSVAPLRLGGPQLTAVRAAIQHSKRSFSRTSASGRTPVALRPVNLKEAWTGVSVAPLRLGGPQWQCFASPRRRTARSFSRTSASGRTPVQPPHG